MKKNAITIGIITYNEENNILKFFDSLKSQRLGRQVGYCRGNFRRRF